MNRWGKDLFAKSQMNPEVISPNAEPSLSCGIQSNKEIAGNCVCISSLLHELHASHMQYTDALLFHHLSITMWEY